MLVVDWWIFFFVALILTLLTSGRLQRGLDRLLVASFAVPLVILPDRMDAVRPGRGQLLLAFPDADVAHVIDRVQRGLLACSCVVTVVVIAARWWRTSGPRRRALLPSLAGALALLFFTALLVNDLVSGTRSQALLWIAACSLVTVPAAFLAGLLRSRLARGGLAELFRGLGTMRAGRAAGAAGAHARRSRARRRVLAAGVPVLRRRERGRASRSPPPAATGRSRPSSATGDRVAALVYDASLDDDPELVEAVTAAAAIALENEHLHAESQARLVELQGVARADRRGRRRRAPAARAQPPRRRPAAARRHRAAAAAAAEPHRRRPVGARSS